MGFAVAPRGEELDWSEDAPAGSGEEPVKRTNACTAPALKLTGAITKGLSSEEGAKVPTCGITAQVRGLALSLGWGRPPVARPRP